MEAGLFVISIAAYAAIYFVVKLVSRLVLGENRDAVRPRVIALVAMILGAVALCAWARFNLVDEALLATLPDFESGQYVGSVVGAFIFPAFVATIVVLFRIRRARSALAERAKQQHRR